MFVKRERECGLSVNKNLMEKIKNFKFLFIQLFSIRFNLI